MTKDLDSVANLVYLCLDPDDIKKVPGPGIQVKMSNFLK
jgi:hypothetical protein